MKRGDLAEGEADRTRTDVVEGGEAVVPAGFCKLEESPENGYGTICVVDKERVDAIWMQGVWYVVGAAGAPAGALPDGLDEGSGIDPGGMIDSMYGLTNAKMSPGMSAQEPTTVTLRLTCLVRGPRPL